MGPTHIDADLAFVRNICSVWPSSRCVGFLLLPQLAPAFVLLGFGGFGIFLTFQPEAIPVHGTLLRQIFLLRPHEFVRALGIEILEFHWLFKPLERGIYFPFSKRGRD